MASSEQLSGNPVVRKVQCGATGKEEQDTVPYFDNLNRQDVGSIVAWLQDYISALKKGRLQPYCPLERKVRAATRKGNLQPTNEQLKELADFSFNSEFRQIMFTVLHERLNQPRYKWSNINKALIVIQTLLIYGSEECIRRMEPETSRLFYLAGYYDYVSWTGQDPTEQIRTRAETIIKLLQNTKLLTRKRLQVTVLQWLQKSYGVVGQGVCNQQDCVNASASDVEKSSSEEDDDEEFFSVFAQDNEVDIQSEQYADCRTIGEDSARDCQMSWKQKIQAEDQIISEYLFKFEGF